MPYDESDPARQPPLRLVKRESLLPGGAGSFQELYAMRELIRHDMGLGPVRTLAKNWIRGCPPMNAHCYARAIHNGLWDAFHVQGISNYTPDAAGREELIYPATLAAGVLQTGGLEGDCKKNALLAAAVAKAVRLRTKLSSLAIGNPLGRLSHVRALAWDGKGWYSLDVTYRSAKPARRPVELEV
jgi:hypothetical protein